MGSAEEKESGADLLGMQQADTVWPLLVIVFRPCFDPAPGITQTGKPVRVQALIPKLAVEAFDRTVLHRLAGLYMP